AVVGVVLPLAVAQVVDVGADHETAVRVLVGPEALFALLFVPLVRRLGQRAGAFVRAHPSSSAGMHPRAPSLRSTRLWGPWERESAGSGVVGVAAPVRAAFREDRVAAPD